MLVSFLVVRQFPFLYSYHFDGIYFSITEHILPTTIPDCYTSQTSPHGVIPSAKHISVEFSNPITPVPLQSCTSCTGNPPKLHPEPTHQFRHIPDIINRCQIAKIPGPSHLKPGPRSLPHASYQFPPKFPISLHLRRPHHFPYDAPEYLTRS